MTTLSPPPFDLDALSADIRDVFARHGAASGSLQVDVRQILQSGLNAGVSVTAAVYTPPADMPAAAPPSGGDPFDDLIARLNQESVS